MHELYRLAILCTRNNYTDQLTKRLNIILKKCKNPPYNYHTAIILSYTITHNYYFIHNNRERTVFTTVS